MVGSHESKSEHPARSSQETIGRFLIWETQSLRRGNNFVSQRATIPTMTRVVIRLSQTDPSQSLMAQF